MSQLVFTTLDTQINVSQYTEDVMYKDKAVLVTLSVGSNGYNTCAQFHLIKIWDCPSSCLYQSQFYLKRDAVSHPFTSLFSPIEQ